LSSAEAITLSSAERSSHSDSRAFQQRVERLCTILGVAGARLSASEGGGRTVICCVGRQAAELADLETIAWAGEVPYVVADTGSSVGFYAGFTLPGADGAPAMLLSLFDHKGRSESVAQGIAAIAREVLARAQVRRQQELLTRQKAIIADFDALEAQRRMLFDRASATAKLGVWQYSLSEQTLYWTDGVYDIFDLPRKMALTREMILNYYTPESLQAMEAVRAQAITNCSDFSIDIEITTAKGNHKWVRLTGAVEARDGRAHRIFGVKQDITEEKLLTDRTRYLAEYDVMTGLANRGRFQAHLDELEQRQIGALLLVDLDGFKQINDTYGHAVGDACLKEAADRLRSRCTDAVLVSRIGGDEFAVLINASTSRQEVEALAQSIVADIGEPVNCLGHALVMGASVGLAHAGGWAAEDLFRQADAALYAAKAAGRNTTRTYSAAA
jgi:diguanylate cyclase (GGDEF)-like protein